MSLLVHSGLCPGNDMSSLMKPPFGDNSNMNKSTFEERVQTLGRIEYLKSYCVNEVSNDELSP